MLVLFVPFLIAIRNRAISLAYTTEVNLFYRVFFDFFGEIINKSL
ncbi:hypothetical protein XBJ2_440146 [Xenorhabdus bovienii str. Jollieti]|uniref:Uncharacterized protein n=2 Tax=Xenorhabdus bovienii TaxID=40576 RepID=A0A077QF66_XENBV|nr:hypothetical protein XBJ1_1079 [Xenorhabdus bovienii SS-2004]CDH29929.1 hypothetical protein XBJ2_440146 [Xenorhabdus bovienii str. Jollieti]CDH30911.1 hypothetical protein XBI1_1150039 [Xenorhabdus bovienii str. Intermedium]